MAEKTTRIRRTFTPQFKKDAVRLLSKGRSATDLADSLGPRGGRQPRLGVQLT